MQKNMGSIDRLVRAFLLAPAALTWAALAGWTSGWGIVALAVAGIMLVTAAVGFCPLYVPLRIDTRGTRRPARV